MNYTTAPTTPEGHRRLAIIRAWNAQAREWWNENGAPDPATARAVAAGQDAAAPGEASRVAALPIKVHTSRPTVQNRALPDGTFYDPETGEVIG
jgi:hypothetical protein